MTKLEELLKQQTELDAAIAVEVKKSEDAAIKGDSEAQFQVANLHYKGQGVKQNFAEAFNEDVSLRTLDAIHVASALLISGSIDGMITYDKQMAKNAKKMGINVLSPGAKV